MPFITMAKDNRYIHTSGSAHNFIKLELFSLIKKKAFIVSVREKKKYCLFIRSSTRKCLLFGEGFGLPGIYFVVGS